MDLLFLDYGHLQLGVTNVVPKNAGATVCLDAKHRDLVIEFLSKLGTVSFADANQQVTAVDYPTLIQFERTSEKEIRCTQINCDKALSRIKQLQAAFSLKLTRTIINE